MKRGLCLFVVVLMLVLSLPLNLSAAEMKWVDWEKAEEAGCELITETLFWDGLAVVIDPQSQYNYIDENYKVVDLNRGRFEVVFPFFEGLAAVIDKNNKLGYINKNGDIVIACLFGQAGMAGSDVYAGFFRDGTATVFKRAYDNVLDWGREEPMEVLVAQIDTKGTIVKKFWDCAEKFKGLHLISKYGEMFDYDEMAELQEKQANDPTSSASKWALPEILSAKEKGLLTPNTSTSFQTDITRGQFAELVVNMVERATGSEMKTAAENTFTDCKDTAVLKAFASGIVNGTSSTTFSPQSLITREQIATMLYRAVTYIERVTEQTYMQKNDSLNAYADKKDVSSWAKTGVGIMANNGIMKGTSETMLSPQGKASVEQCILLVYRIFKTVYQFN